MTTTETTDELLQYAIRLLDAAYLSSDRPPIENHLWTLAVLAMADDHLGDRRPSGYYTSDVYVGEWGDHALTLGDANWSQLLTARATVIAHEAGWLQVLEAEHLSEYLEDFEDVIRLTYEMPAHLRALMTEHVRELLASDAASL
jgi:hypothetical protein